MMNPSVVSTGMYPMFFFFGIGHMAIALAFVVGIFFLLAYAWKQFTPSELRQWGVWLVAGSVVGAVLFALLMTAFHDGGYPARGSYGKQRGWMMQYGTYPEDANF